MLKIDNVSAVNGFDVAIRGMRNPLNSWDKSDSKWVRNLESLEADADDNEPPYLYEVGPNDLALMSRLVKAGSDHRKFMRYITVGLDVVAPMYWWKEFDTYKVGTVRNSCSTMHKLLAREFTFGDFSYESLYSSAMVNNTGSDNEIFDVKYDSSKQVLGFVIKVLNQYRDLYLNWEERETLGLIPEGWTKSGVWMNMIQLLPSSYNQRSTITVNYEVLRAMYHARKHHKLGEWRTFCEWIETLPYSELITMEA